MAQLIVRNLEEEVVRQLKIRAARKGLSAEAEHREILRQTLLDDPTAATLEVLLLSIPNVGSDDDFARPRDSGRPVEFQV